MCLQINWEFDKNLWPAGNVPMVVCGWNYFYYCDIVDYMIVCAIADILAEYESVRDGGSDYRLRIALRPWDPAAIGIVKR